MEARLSTFKEGHGHAQLFSENPDEYWHTDGNLPHHVEIELEERKVLSEIVILLDHAHDKSYTPKELDIRCGKTRGGIRSVKKVFVNEKATSVEIPVEEECVYLQIVILSNHQEGRDSRIRNLKLLFREGAKQ
jgi:anaphase-promoting complex subunit 10